MGIADFEHIAEQRHLDRTFRVQVADKLEEEARVRLEVARELKEEKRKRWKVEDANVELQRECTKLKDQLNERRRECTRLHHNIEEEHRLRADAEAQSQALDKELRRAQAEIGKLKVHQDSQASDAIYGEEALQDAWQVCPMSILFQSVLRRVLMSASTHWFCREYHRTRECASVDALNTLYKSGCVEI